MQALDVDTLERLQRRFTSLDSGEQGLLELGTEVPNAEQVKRLQEIQKEPSSTHRSLPRTVPRTIRHGTGCCSLRCRWSQSSFG